MKRDSRMGVLLGWALLLVAGCSSAEHVVDAAVRIKAADWAQMHTVTVELSEYSFAPSNLRFRAGVPYKLQIVNHGTAKHYFTASEFFKAIATRKVQSNTDGEIKVSYLLALEVFPGRSLDLSFIPVKKGRYDLLCTIENHADRGMIGSIVIE